MVTETGSASAQEYGLSLQVKLKKRNQFENELVSHRIINQQPVTNDHFLLYV